MSSYSIADFWKLRLSVQPVAGMNLVAGWMLVDRPFDTFLEAPLSLSPEFDSATDPKDSSVIFVSAPGAVGKSTLARQIAFATGAIYVDLAEADPVGGNTISGGLAKSNVFPEWQDRKVAVLIDGLDEARLRVTQNAFESFLSDVAQISAGRSVPTILFGRTGAVQDAWFTLAGQGLEVPVLEIGFFGPGQSIEFAMALVRKIRADRAHDTSEREAIRLLLEGLRGQTETDGDRFSGYAPVLQAVASHVARESNVSHLIADIKKGSQPVTLNGVANSILERERGKLKPIPFVDASLPDRLYLPEEQLDRLVARVYGVSPPDLPTMAAKDAETYSSALETWVADHPFLDGSTKASSAVFEAVISTRALKNPRSSKAAVQAEIRKGASANPFLAEFYVSDEIGEERQFLPPDQVGIIYASIRARLSLGDTASLGIDGAEDAVEEEALKADVEIVLLRSDNEQTRTLSFESEQAGTLRLGAYVEDVEINAPMAAVEIGPGPEAILVAPVSIQCDRLTIVSENVIVENPLGAERGTVYLETKAFDGATVTSTPTLRGDVSLSAAWPGSRVHPWTSFSTEPSTNEDPRIDEALRRFRKFVISFRSHSKGRLARFQDKIESGRMTKGTGQAVLKLMINQGIMTLGAPMYYLDPQRLAELTGATYGDCMARRFGPKTVEFVERAL